MDRSDAGPLAHVALLFDPPTLTDLAGHLDRLGRDLRDAGLDCRRAAERAGVGLDFRVASAIATTAEWAEAEARDLRWRTALTDGALHHPAAVTFSWPVLHREVAGELTALTTTAVGRGEALRRLGTLRHRLDRLSRDPAAAAAVLGELGPEGLLAVVRLLRGLAPHTSSADEAATIRAGIARVVAAASRSGALPEDWVVHLLAAGQRPMDVAPLLADGRMALPWLLPLAAAALAPTQRSDGLPRWPDEVVQDRRARAAALGAVLRNDASAALLRHLPDAAVLTREGYADLGAALGRVIGEGTTALARGGEDDLALGRRTIRRLIVGLGEYSSVEPLALGALATALGRWPGALVPDRPGFDDSPGAGVLDEATLRAGLEPLVAGAVPPELLAGIRDELATLVRLHFADDPDEAGRRMHEIVALLGVVLDTHLDHVTGAADRAAATAVIADLVGDVALGLTGPVGSLVAVGVDAGSAVLDGAPGPRERARLHRGRTTVEIVERELLWAVVEIARREVSDLPPPPLQDGVLVRWWQHDPAVVGVPGPLWERFEAWRGRDDVEDRLNDLESRIRAAAWEVLDDG